MCDENLSAAKQNSVLRLGTSSLCFVVLNMADDDRNRRKRADSDVPEWKETCIGVWSKSEKGHQVTEDNNNRICYGISVVRISKVGLYQKKLIEFFHNYKNPSIDALFQFNRI